MIRHTPPRSLTSLLFFKYQEREENVSTNEEERNKESISAKLATWARKSLTLIETTQRENPKKFFEIETLVKYNVALHAQAKVWVSSC